MPREPNSDAIVGKCGDTAASRWRRRQNPLLRSNNENDATDIALSSHGRMRRKAEPVRTRKIAGLRAARPQPQDLMEMTGRHRLRGLPEGKSGAGSTVCLRTDTSYRQMCTVGAPSGPTMSSLHRIGCRTSPDRFPLAGGQETRRVTTSCALDRT